MSQVSNAKARQLLQSQLDQIPSLEPLSKGAHEFDLWRRNTRMIIKRLFPEHPDYLKQFDNLSFSAPVLPVVVPRSGPTKYPDDHPFYIRGVQRADALLQSLMTEIENFWEDEPLEQTSPTNQTTTQIIERVCDRFHSVVRQLRKRHSNRPTLEVNDEYDVQDLMHALLLVHFDDVRREESTISFAGKSSRMDFMLKREKTALETKHSRAGLTAKELGDELIIDIRRYKKTHPYCRFLICFAYDPTGLIDNPRGIENDLSVVTEGLPVKVIIRP